MSRKFSQQMVLAGALLFAPALFAQESSPIYPVTDVPSQLDVKPVPAPTAVPVPVAGPSCDNVGIIKKCVPHQECKEIMYKSYCCECRDYCAIYPTLKEVLHCVTHPGQGDHTPIPGSVIFPQKEQRCLCNRDAACCEGCTHCVPKTRKVLIKFDEPRQVTLTKCEVECEAVPSCSHPSNYAAHFGQNPPLTTQMIPPPAIQVVPSPKP